MIIKLFYRCGGNYKFNVEFPITYDQLVALAEKRGEGLKEGDELEYDNDLGITQEEFHEKVGYPYDDEIDHNFVTVEGIYIPSKEEINT